MRKYFRGYCSKEDTRTLDLRSFRVTYWDIGVYLDITPIVSIKWKANGT